MSYLQPCKQALIGQLVGGQLISRSGHKATCPLCGLKERVGSLLHHTVWLGLNFYDGDTEPQVRQRQSQMQDAIAIKQTPPWPQCFYLEFSGVWKITAADWQILDLVYELFPCNWRSCCRSLLSIALDAPAWSSKTASLDLNALRLLSRLSWHFPLLGNVKSLVLTDPVDTSKFDLWLVRQRRML